VNSTPKLFYAYRVLVQVPLNGGGHVVYEGQALFDHPYAKANDESELRRRVAAANHCQPADVEIHGGPTEIRFEDGWAQQRRD
jgi:hypothetical protein